MHRTAPHGNWTAQDGSSAKCKRSCLNVPVIHFRYVIHSFHQNIDPYTFHSIWKNITVIIVYQEFIFSCRFPLKTKRKKGTVFKGKNVNFKTLKINFSTTGLLNDHSGSNFPKSLYKYIYMGLKICPVADKQVYTNFFSLSKSLEGRKSLRM